MNPEEIVIVGGEAVISPTASLYPVYGWATVPGSAFIPDNPATDTALIGNFAYNEDGNLTAAIQLPHGATVVEFCAKALDNAAANTSIDLESVDGDGFAQTEASLSTTGEDSVTQDVCVTDYENGLATISNNRIGWQVFVSGADQPGQVIYSASVKYRIGSP